MLVDHIGFILFPDVMIYRIIGRLAMPLFAWAIARGYYYSNLKGTDNKYLLNLTILAVISQVPSYLMVSSSFNIVFTWVLALLILKLPKFSPFWIILGLIIPVDYGIFGVLLPVIIYYFWFKQELPWLAIIFSSSWLILFSTLQWDVQYYSLLALPIAFFLQKFEHLWKLNKWVFYWFYPVHLVVLLLIGYFVFDYNLPLV